MSYAAAIDELNAMTPELFTQPGHVRRKFSLDEVRILLRALGDPQRAFKSVLIAGTNGKGSTASTLASILLASGVRTGLYTSPHLERINERIRVQDAEISDDDFALQYFHVHHCAEDLVRRGELARPPSFFETLTAMAFAHFASAGVEVAVLEVGMGGRLDATNVVDPLLSIVTDISLDHMEWLGNSISAIAREKAGILRPNGALVTLSQHPEANHVLGEVATGLNVRGVSATPYMPNIDAGPADSYPLEVLGTQIEISSPLIGAHQHRNIALAIAAAVELRRHHARPITAASIAAGIHNTRWPGRLEHFSTRNHDWILDVAHNPAGAWALRAGLRHRFSSLPSGAQRTLIFSCLRDKPVNELAQILFPIFDRILFAPIASPRAANPEDLLRAALSTGTPAQVVDSAGQAIRLAGDDPIPGLIVVSGSVYLVGEARSILRRQTALAGEPSL